MTTSEAPVRHQAAAAVERSFVLLRPEAVAQGLVTSILRRLERLPARLIGLKPLQPTARQIRTLYSRSDIGDRLPEIVDSHLAGPVVAAVFEGPVGIGARIEQEVNFIRRDHGIDRLRNCVHASDTASGAERELRIFFDAEAELPSPYPLTSLPRAELRIAVEGICCAGKTTLVDQLAGESGLVIVPEATTLCRAFPDPPMTGEQARTNERFCLLVETLRHCLDGRGRAAVYDRSYLSVLGIAYGYLPRVGADAFQALVEDMRGALERGDLVAPDLYIYLDLPVSKVRERNLRRADSLTEFWTDPGSLARQRRFYRSWFGSITSIRVCRIDARRAIADVRDAARAAIRRVEPDRRPHHRYAQELAALGQALPRGLPQSTAPQAAAQSWS